MFAANNIKNIESSDCSATLKKALMYIYIYFKIPGSILDHICINVKTRACILLRGKITFKVMF